MLFILLGHGHGDGIETRSPAVSQPPTYGGKYPTISNPGPARSESWSSLHVGGSRHSLRAFPPGLPREAADHDVRMPYVFRAAVREVSVC